ncbi:hypothetical protein QEH42_gp258 [Microbacterium phage Pumpernickel]|uniref:Uncharacterized protein n=1 Tax=Microbacterium phage Pumpernickel TaxID=2885983 RepID=A0AAE8Y790_9CAUD|nr:hypothetical protein QEH42_gp258 [Microbacterium phage Pumpernickel]UDL15960.1 hypothetical protein SEA_PUMPERNICKEL_210 [Microbacterium phage Pumpernickel]
MKTVKDLMMVLRNMDPDQVVVLASDPEGNSFLEWSGDVSAAYYDEDAEWESRVYFQEDEDEDDDEESEPEEFNAIVIWP